MLTVPGVEYREKRPQETPSTPYSPGAGAEPPSQHPESDSDGDSDGDAYRVYDKSADLSNLRSSRYRPPTDYLSARPLAYECVVRRPETDPTEMHLNPNLETTFKYSNAWSNRKATLGYSETELLVISAAESFADESDKIVVTMHSQTNAFGKLPTTSSNQIRWL